MRQAVELDSTKKITVKAPFRCKKHKDVECEILTSGDKIYHFCPKCAKDQTAQEIRNKARIQQGRINRGISNSMLSSRFRSKTFDNYIVENSRQIKVVEEIKKFIENFEACVGIILIGKNGTGKNHLASAIVNEIIRKQGKTALITKAIKIVRKIKESWKREDEYESTIVNSFVTPDLLVIDELGVQYCSDTEKMYLTEIIDDRYEEHNPTILSGNVTIEELETIVGERAIDRFREKNYKGDSVIVFDWESYRGKRN